VTGRLDGKVAIVTGATSGIGEGIARQFVTDGASILFTGRNVDKGQQLAAELGPNSRFLVTHVEVESEIEQMIATTVDTFGQLDCLVSNAGGGQTPGAVMEIEADGLNYTFQVFVGSVVYGMKHAAPHMKESGGSIINISSVAANHAGFGGYAYSGAKAAVTQMSKWAAMHLAPFKIRVNTISPGPVVTSIFTRTASGDQTATMDPQRTANLERIFEEITPLHIAGVPSDIAHAAVYFAADESRYVTGQDLEVDGGLGNSRPAEEVADLWQNLFASVVG
jgi:NAD(P)-dependent dehydrogenase (short-subunit alcohol dehydrogenase family)